MQTGAMCGGRSVGRLLGGLGLALALGSAPARADCAGASVFFTHLNLRTAIALNTLDTAAFWLTYFHEDPSIHQGLLPVLAVAFDGEMFGGAPGTAVVFGDWSAGLGMQGCPFSLDGNSNGLLDDDAAHEVFVFGDSRSVTLIVVGSVGNVFDFDRTSPLAGPLAPLPTWPLRPVVLSAVDTSDGVRVELSWSAPVINRDTQSEAIAAGLVGEQRILEERQAGSEVSVRTLEDRDGSLRDSHALLLLQPTPGFQDFSRLAVQVQLNPVQPLNSAPTFAGPYTPQIPVPLEIPDLDLDGDGYYQTAGDCDDSRTDVHPGAAEVCDGVDNDCNRKTDEIDADADGYLACAGDCDDANPAVHPGAREVCNGLDDDCDGRVDRACRRRWPRG